MFFVDVDIMTTDQLKEVLGNYKWTLLVALIMFAMVGFGYKLARIIDEGDSKKVQAVKHKLKQVKATGVPKAGGQAQWADQDASIPYDSCT